MDKRSNILGFDLAFPKDEAVKATRAIPFYEMRGVFALMPVIAPKFDQDALACQLEIRVAGTLRIVNPERPTSGISKAELLDNHCQMGFCLVRTTFAPFQHCLSSLVSTPSSFAFFRQLCANFRRTLSSFQCSSNLGAGLRRACPSSVLRALTFHTSLSGGFCDTCAPFCSVVRLAGKSSWKSFFVDPPR